MGTSCAEDKLGLEFEDNFFLRQLFRVVNFLVYRVRRPAPAPCHLQCVCIKWGPLSQTLIVHTIDMQTSQLVANSV